MRVSIIDLEATCWEDNNGHESEIIEIGCALLDIKTGEIMDNRSIYVTPLSKGPLSDFCVKLTGITDSRLRKSGKTFDLAIKELKKNYPTSQTWFSWGAYDEHMLLKECVKKNVEFPFKHGKHINLKELFRIMKKQKRGVGMIKAMELLGIERYGRHHSGKWDAYNTTLIVKELLL